MGEIRHMKIENIFDELNQNKLIGDIPSVYVVKIVIETLKILDRNNLIDLEDIPNEHESL